MANSIQRIKRIGLQRFRSDQQLLYCSDLTSVKFDGSNLTGAKITMAALNGAALTAAF
jgi:uncharacterized protein YjbI with pentapeptide repeats